MIFKKGERKKQQMAFVGVIRPLLRSHKSLNFSQAALCSLHGLRQTLVLYVYCGLEMV